MPNLIRFDTSVIKATSGKIMFHDVVAGVHCRHVHLYSASASASAKTQDSLMSYGEIDVVTEHDRIRGK